MTTPVSPITLKPTVTVTLPEKKQGNDVTRPESQLEFNVDQTADDGKTTLKALAQKAHIDLNQIDKTPAKADAIKAAIAVKAASITAAELKSAIIKATVNGNDLSADEITKLSIEDSEAPALFAKALYDAVEVKEVKNDSTPAAKTKLLADIAKDAPKELGLGKVISLVAGIGGALLGLIIGGSGENAGRGLFASILGAIGGAGLVAAFPAIGKVFGRNVVHYEVPAADKKAEAPKS